MILFYYHYINYSTVLIRSWSGGGIKRYTFTDKFGTDNFKETSLVYVFNSRGDINMDRHGKPNIPVPDQDRLFAIILWYVAKTLY